jgi:hypothetical protein
MQGGHTKPHDSPLMENIFILLQNSQHCEDVLVKFLLPTSPILLPPPEKPGAHRVPHMYSCMQTLLWERFADKCQPKVTE